MRLILTLVHGTWARGSAWTLPDSPLLVSIRSQFPQTVVRSLAWSGLNRGRARFEAGRKLKEFLLEGFSGHPESCHVVIAHSHGGNAAMYSFRDPVITDRLAGIVLMATPFLHIDRLPLPVWLARRTLRATIAAVLMLCYFTLLISSVNAIDRWTSPEFYDTLFGLSVILVPAVALIGAGPLSRRMWRHGVRLRREGRLPREFKTPTLLFRATGDEASGTLAVGGIGALVTLRLGELLSWLVWRVESLKPWSQRGVGGPGSIVLILVIALAMWVSYFRELAGAWFSSRIVLASLAVGVMWVFILAAGFYVPSVLSLLLGLVLSPVYLLRAIALLPYGIDIALAAPVLDVAAEATPPGRWTIMHACAHGSATPVPWRQLSHSALYRQANTIAAIVSFISIQLAAQSSRDDHSIDQ
jgi:hypothetical protein